MKQIAMSCESLCQEVTDGAKSNDKFKNDYKLDFYREVRKRWTVLGVLAVIALAVLCPRVGAPGGPLRTEYLVHPPLWYIYYSAGRAQGGRARRVPWRLVALCAAHAHLLAPALCAAVLTAVADGLDYRIVKGAMLSSIGCGCAWLSLALGGAASLAATNYVVALVAAPLGTLLLCGRAPVPPLGGVISALVSRCGPFSLGLWRPLPSLGPGPRAAALLVLYAQFCAHLAPAGPAAIEDVLAVMVLELVWVGLSAMACVGYVRVGLLSAADGRFLALAAVPKGLDMGWHTSTICDTDGLSSLPAIFLAPTQALLLTAIADSCDSEEEDNGLPK